MRFPIVCWSRTARAQLDFAMIFLKSQAEMKEQFPKFARRLAPAGMLWVSWPKKTSGVVTDLNENDVQEDWAAGWPGGCESLRRE